MSEYTVEWEIELNADSPKEAAELALDMQRDTFSEAVCFKVSKDGKFIAYVDFMSED